MGIFSKKKKDNDTTSSQFKFVDGPGGFFKGELVILEVKNSTGDIKITSKFKNKKTKEFKSIILDNDRIIRSEFLSEQDIIEKNKSVAGRAVAGGLLLGPLGAIVGGMSGTGKKEKKGDITNYVVINYDEDKVISLEVPATSFNFSKVIDKINNG